MEMTKESLHFPSTLLDEVAQNKFEPIINKQLKQNKDDYLCTSDENYLEKNIPCNLQKEVQNENIDQNKREKYETNNEISNEESVNENVDLSNAEKYNETNNDISNEESVNENVDLSNAEKYNETNNDISNEESVNENVKDTVDEVSKKAQLKFSSHSKKILDEKNIKQTFNDSLSGNSSSDEEILQTRFPVKDECYSFKSSSFASISDNESSLETNSKTERPLVIQATAYVEKKSVDCKTNSPNSEIINQTEKNSHQEAATDRTNYSLSVDVDNSNIETESSYMQSLTINKDTALNYDETKDKNKILPQEIVKTANKTIDKIDQERNCISPDIIKNFFNGSFDISIFKPERNSTMIEDKLDAKQKHLMKNEHYPNKKKKYRGNVYKNTNNKEVHNVLDYSNKAEHKKLKNNNPNADSIIQLKRKLSEKHTKNSKKARVITGKNKDITDRISEKLTLKAKSKLENKYSKASNQRKRVNSTSQFNDKDLTVLNNFNLKKENSQKNKTKNIPRTKLHKNEEIFKDFSNNIIPLKKSRNLRSSSLVASKKIKEIEKFENAYSGEEILLDSDSSCFDSNIKQIDDSFKSIFKDQKSLFEHKAENKLEKDKFHNEGINITSLEDFQICFENQRKRESERTNRNNRKCENMIENIFDSCHKTAKCQLKMDSITSEENFIFDSYQSDFLVQENRDINENYQSSKKRISYRQQSQSNKKTEKKLLEYSKNIDKATPSKKATKSITNYGITTRSKKKTWDMLQKELLGESNDAPYSNTITKTVLLTNQSIRKQSMKDVNIYSTPNKSVIQTISMLDKRNKYDGKYNIQDTESKYLQTPANNIQFNETVQYKSRNIVEKTIAAMERCTAGFITPKENIFEKEWIHGEEGSDDMIDKISIDEEEFHSNMTFVTKENEKYYKNEIVAIVKQSSSMKHATPCKTVTRTMYSGEEYKYGFSDTEHLIKKSIVTENYSVEDNSEENLKTKSQTLIPLLNEKQSDPWTRLIKELNLEKCNNEDNCKSISSGKPNKKSLIYHENLKQHTNVHLNKDGEMQFIVDLNQRELYKQDEIEKEQNKQVLKQLTSDKILAELNHMAICTDLNAEDNSITNNTEPGRNNKNAELGSVSIIGKTRKMETKERYALQMKKGKTSPKFKVQVENGGVKFKRCNRSFSSTSEESEKQRNKKRDKKFQKDHQNLGRQKYKRYLNSLFEKKKSKDNKMESMSEGQNSKKNPVKEKNKEQGKMINTLIAKDDDDLFSISSSDSELVNKGTGLLCDIFDE